MTNATESLSLTVSPLSGYIGAEISGVDLTRELDDDTVAGIRAALLRWKVVFFREQHIDHAQQIAFAGRFGELTAAHPYEEEPPAGFPEILPIDSRRYVAAGKGNKATYESRWHTDVTALVNPPAASILRAEIVPPYGGDTAWTNLVAAYEALPYELRTLADGLRAQHSFGPVAQGQLASHPYLQRIQANPLVAIHPVVRVHPETGERALFVSPGFTDHIVGFPKRASAQILELLFEQIARPELTVWFRWEPGSVAFWDNRATAHLGPSDLNHLDFDRVLYRVTLVGDVPVGPDGRKSELVSGAPFLAN